MLLIVGTVRLPPDNLAAARPVMERMIAASRAEPGCRGYSYAEDLLDPGLIRVAEMWDDRAALDAHFASSHLAAWRAAWPSLGLGSRDLTLHEVAASTPT
ncbi:antibiotic biosynthesis monooxygenase [Lichenibacterium minor]|jgi:quinol monooxygenase YgiN|uniref:Antibiotic biosynthesis monooxygenase n=1 Tax=Lichenibacterium minor TaxID=2316528 RepID=A0A4Q2U6E3_9HYPH|nr:putative quinol monooxygenase [Lichenibacterium minor]RYC32193.1 antibiotic biosynthesis monooxygenase [Lichenibacterium minor]